MLFIYIGQRRSGRSRRIGVFRLDVFVLFLELQDRAAQLRSREYFFHMTVAGCVPTLLVKRFHRRSFKEEIMKGKVIGNVLWIVGLLTAVTGCSFLDKGTWGLFIVVGVGCVLCNLGGYIERY